MYLRPFYLLASKNVPLKSAQKLMPIGLINQNVDQRRWANTINQTTYQDSRDRDLRLKQRRFQPPTPSVFIERKEVETNDGYRLVEPLIDPSQKPHELHLIKKVSGLKNEPYWVRDALAKLGFKTKKKDEWSVIYSVHPNTTRVNELLWLCKHLVKVTPIKFKNGFPSESDIGNTKLNLETGELEIIKQLEYFSEDEGRLDCYKVNGTSVSDDLRPDDSFPLRKADLHKDFRRRYELRRLNEEYFPTRQSYALDQDKPGVVRLPGKASTDINEDNTEMS